MAPRGYGRTSYRLAEIIQLGRIPVYIFDDFEWLPYLGTNASPVDMGYSTQLGRIGLTLDRLKKDKPDKETISKLLAKVKQNREWYTYEGVLSQIELFIIDPLGPGGFLRCVTQTLPTKDH